MRTSASVRRLWRRISASSVRAFFASLVVAADALARRPAPADGATMDCDGWIVALFATPSRMETRTVPTQQSSNPRRVDSSIIQRARARDSGDDDDDDNDDSDSVDKGNETSRSRSIENARSRSLKFFLSRLTVHP
jgi:hypothetical protein